MCYRKLTTMGFLAFCAFLALFFGAVEVEGFTFLDAKDAVENFLNYLLPQLNIIEDVSDVYSAESLEELAALANQHINNDRLNRLHFVLSSNKNKEAEIREMYMKYQTFFIELLDERDWTRNKEIPLAYQLAERLCVPRPEFDLDRAKEQVSTMIVYLCNLLGFQNLNLTVINDAANLEALSTIANNFFTEDHVGALQSVAAGLTSDQNTLAQMISNFNNYVATFTNLLIADPLTRGKEIPLSAVISAIASVWRQ